MEGEAASRIGAKGKSLLQQWVSSPRARRGQGPASLAFPGRARRVTSHKQGPDHLPMPRGLREMPAKDREGRDNVPCRI